MILEGDKSDQADVPVSKWQHFRSGGFVERGNLRKTGFLLKAESASSGRKCNKCETALRRCLKKQSYFPCVAIPKGYEQCSRKPPRNEDDLWSYKIGASVSGSLKDVKLSQNRVLQF